VFDPLSESYSHVYPNLSFRLDLRTGNIFILAGEAIEIVVTRDGKWGLEE